MERMAEEGEEGQKEGGRQGRREGEMNAPDLLLLRKSLSSGFPEGLIKSQ